MPIWLVRATWVEDEVEASEQWQVNAATADEAIKDVTPHVRFPPHHIEARPLSSEGENVPDVSGLEPGQARRIPPQ